jgi:hypothetical protein
MVRVPQITVDDNEILDQLHKAGEAVGHRTLQERCKFSDNRYEASRKNLIAKKLAVTVAGGRGSLGLTDDGKAVPSAKVKESLLYGPLCDVPLKDWKQTLGHVPIVVDNTAMQGGRVTGGRWTRPDLVSVGLESFDYVPHLSMDVSSVEVKSFVSVDIAAVYEALAHRRASTRAWVFFYIPPHLEVATKNQVFEVCSVAGESGIGVVTFGDPRNTTTWRVKQRPIRVVTDPALLNDFIKVQMSETAKDQIRAKVAQIKRGGEEGVASLDLEE